MSFFFENRDNLFCFTSPHSYYDLKLDFAVLLIFLFLFIHIFYNWKLKVEECFISRAVCHVTCDLKKLDIRKIFGLSFLWHLLQSIFLVCPIALEIPHFQIFLAKRNILKSFNQFYQIFHFLKRFLSKKNKLFKNCDSHYATCATGVVRLSISTQHCFWLHPTGPIVMRPIL